VPALPSRLLSSVLAEGDINNADEYKTIRGSVSRMWARLCGSNPLQKYAGDELPQLGPSYVAVMLDMTDSVDGFPFTPFPCFSIFPV
jgi:hypothetical protein